MTTDRYLYVIYCDDVRQEFGNKTSLIGVYGPDLFVNQIPAVLPQLCLVTTVVTDSADPIQSLEVTITRDDEQIAKMSVSSADLTKMMEQAQVARGSTVPAPRLNVVNLVSKIAPFPVERNSVLRVTAKTEREELQGPGLRIAQIAAAKDQTLAPSASAESSLH